MEPSAIKSPCILVCAIEPVTGQCYGCGRSRDEITSWVKYSDQERDIIMAELPDRVAKLERRPRRVTRRSRAKGTQTRVTSLSDSAFGDTDG
ncbi:DUF1289 domain-containing protein [Pseudahrensia aquimaris]|uniref:DUF1289 domain-containing protein n=1 Tax=Pseudahrensia aquimaris TaxID=744461 RepID=A0ABW3FAQ3_9HYPH